MKVKFANKVVDASEIKLGCVVYVPSGSLLVHGGWVFHVCGFINEDSGLKLQIKDKFGIFEYKPEDLLWPTI